MHHRYSIVRSRPAVIFGSDGREGAEAAMRQLMELFVAQAQRGNCSFLHIERNGPEVTLLAGGHGHRLDLLPTDDPELLKDLLSEQALPRNNPNKASVFYPQDVDASMLLPISYVSRLFSLTTVRNGVKSFFRVLDGKEADGLPTEMVKEEDCTEIRIILDPAVFRETELSAEFYLEALERYALLSPGLSCSYTEQNTESTVFHYPEGIHAYHKGLPSYRYQLATRGKDSIKRPDYDASVEVSIAPAAGHSRLLLFHNMRRMRCDGVYKTALETMYRSFRALDPAVRRSDLEGQFSIVIATWCTQKHSRWVNGERRAITNPLIEALLQEAVGKSFLRFLETNREAFLP